MFKCKCGKTFEKRQALYGHQSHCEINLGPERYKKILIKNKEIGEKSSKTLKKQFKEKKENELKKWINEKHKCEKCGKIMTEKYASGRFCSIQCSKSFSSLSNNEQRKKNVQKSIIKAIEENRLIPTNANNRGNYVERYWEFVLNTVYNLHTEKQYKIKKELTDSNKNNHFYFLDILVENHIDLEIDGPYHDSEKDKIRDKFLTDHGFIVYRTNYINPKKHKEKVLLEIEKFVEFVKNNT